MNTPTPQITNTKLVELLKTYWAWRRLWIATTLAFGSFGLFYVVCLKSDKWTASQGLIVRDEANGAVMRLGRFQSQTEMKAAQETILEMARNTQVLREALLEVGPEKTWWPGSAQMTEAWPTQSDLADLADDAIGVRAPKGAEFGTTEVIYLDIKQASRERSLALNRAVCKALDNRLRQVRVARADGVINELVRASSMATEELKKATEQLQIIEREAGADLSDLRGLSENNGASSTSRAQLESVKTELRQIENQHANLSTDLALLRETQTDPERILSAPASILSAHPGLKKLREGLAEAQLSTSQLRGRYADNHPMVFVAASAEKEIKGELQSELALAMAASSKEVENSQRRVDALKRQQQQLEERLTRLAQIRAGHENYNQEVRSRTKILQDAERQLADTRAARDAAITTSLLTRIDEPVLGERPVGPGRTTILAGMTVAGLLFGLGIVFLLTPLDGSAPSDERWNERLGRRLSDRFPWLADQGANGAPRRRRTDVERRQGNRSTDSSRSTSTPASGSWFGRRQSDQQTTSAPAAQPKLAPATPVVQVEDPATANRLDAMLLSELAAAIPTTDPASATAPTTAPTPASNTLPPASPIAQPTAVASITTAPMIEPIIELAVEVEPGDVVSLSAPREEAITLDAVSSSIELDNVAVLTQAIERELAPEESPIIEPASEPVSESIVAPIATPIKEAAPAIAPPISQFVQELPEPAPLPMRKPIKPRLVDRTAPIAPAAPIAPPPPVALETLAAPPTVDAVAQTEVAPPTPTPAKPAKPGLNMFRPNQASSEQPAKPAREPQRPRRADGKSNTPAQASPAPAPAPMPLPLAAPFPSNAFETPAEGGLAGIGLPTQPLPESFQFRQ